MVPSEFYYTGKHVSQWTEAELRHAARNPSVINETLHPVIDARLDAIEANQRLIRERTKSAKRERKLILSFADTTSKPAQSIDARSVKHAVADATKQKGGGPALTVAGVIAAYDWLCGHPELTEMLPKLPPVVWLLVIILGLGWWLILFAARLSEKWTEEH